MPEPQSSANTSRSGDCHAAATAAGGTPRRLVLDTNIVIDLLHFADPATVWLNEPIADGSVRCFATQECIDELASVLPRPQFRLDAAAVERILARYLELVTLVDDSALDAGVIDAIPRCRDRDDQKFLVLAAFAEADLLITRDRELLRLALPGRRAPPCAIKTAAAARDWLATSATQELVGAVDQATQA
ncbi:putative toxin-antitoxin system toxin component, PIN family [Rhodocyclus tenuis]|uniref:Putative PIN family toxin of toxin-antitoxin system n=1 Tax=Rhodocyclus tenuis TaxID=1066 RepID=A0A840G2G9_RHOTE|nr:putative toxin-antitoxin system toxin component, PIN family [Rhodocyclus tenuis]MBB4248504.1 putative PIN family toxin of toxin-antitoxin system [Rhodocyclus tenuis]